jgi:ElaB/YqjD/DUF883 family membrane-anchored ribosome-binding protein
MMYLLGLLTAIPLLAICGVIVYILLKHKCQSNEPELTPADLRALQESAEELIRSITEAAEESLAKFEKSRMELENVIVRANKAASFLESTMPMSDDQAVTESGDRIVQVAKLSESGLDKTEIARQLCIGSGEVELLLSLSPKLSAAGN